MENILFDVVFAGAPRRRCRIRCRSSCRSEAAYTDRRWHHPTCETAHGIGMVGTNRKHIVAVSVRKIILLSTLCRWNLLQKDAEHVHN